LFTGLSPLQEEKLSHVARVAVVVVVGVAERFDVACVVSA